MPNAIPNGLDAIGQIFGEFQVVNRAAPKWLTDSRTGNRLAVDRHYPELGIAVQFKNDLSIPQPMEASHDERLDELCRQAGITLLKIDPHKAISAPSLIEIRGALSAVARRVAQWQGSPEIKREVIPRIATTKAACQEMLDLLTLAPETWEEPIPRYRAGRRARWQRQLGQSWQQSRKSWQLFGQNRMAVAGVVLIVLFGLMSIAHPILRKTVMKKGIYDPVTGYDMMMMHPAPPSLGHLLGTDSLGRDVLSMLLYATTPTFIVGIAAALSTAIIGTIMGVVAAYFRGGIDTILSHISDAMLLVPAPLFMVMIGMRFRDIEPATLGLIYGVIAGAGGAAIVMRSHALTIANKPFIDAARIAGGEGWHIIRKHILPHMLPLAALYMMLAVTSAVVADAFVSFWGFSRSYMNWGNIIYSSFVYSTALTSGVEWHVLIPPSIALSLFAAAFYFVSQGLHELADPRLQAR